MRIEKFMDLAVVIVNDNLAVWFRKTHQKDGWVFIRANENSESWNQPEIVRFEAAHPGMLDDILRRLNNE